MEEKTAKFADRLKDKLSGSSEPVHTDETAAELVESQLEMVSGGASHGSSHASQTDGPTPDEQQ